MSFAATAGLVTAGMTAAEIAAAAAAASAAATAAGTTAATAGGLLGGVAGAGLTMPSMAALAASTAAGTPSATGLLGITGAELASGLGSVGSGLGSAGTATMGLNAAKNLISDDPMQPAQMRQGSPAGPQTVAQIYESGQQSTQNQLDQAAQERMKRRQMWG